MGSLSNAEGRQPHHRGRVAFFGGSFDPPHLGHLAVARAAQLALGLDTVLFAPVGAQPLKPLGSTAEFAHRLAMTRLAIAAEPGFAISLADAPKPAGQPNYTLDTLLGLRAELPLESALFCLMGADSFAGLRRWHRAAEIPFAAPLIVASRPGESLELLDDLKALLPEGLTIEALPAADEENAELEDSALKGHGFSRAGQSQNPDLALATEGMQEMEDALPQGLKPKISTAHQAARLKPCPFKTRIELRCYRLRNPAGASAPFYLLPGLEIEISASEIRDQIRNREQARIQEQTSTLAGGQARERELLPAPVSEYIRANNLYL